METIKIVLDLEKDLHNRIKEYAKQDRRTVKVIYHILLETGLKNLGIIENNQEEVKPFSYSYSEEEKKRMDKEMEEALKDVPIDPFA